MSAETTDQARAHLEFDDNRLLPVLFGEHDRNLARVEQALGVSVVSRGNHLSITGPAGAVQTAEATFRLLYDRLERGLTVNASEVEGALKLASGAAPAAAGAEGLQVRTRKRLISPRSPTQAAYLRSMRENNLVFGLGPAGTGKSYLAVAMAVSMMSAGQVERIILSRPAVEAGERLGFLPGDLREKVDPYLRPLYDALHEMLPGDMVARRLESGEIEVAPLAFMRGRTLAHAFIILDEAQNTTPVQMKMALTRIGEGSHMVVTGDLSQIDLPSGSRSGLVDAMEVLEGVPGVAFSHFSHLDVVRHPLVTRIVRAYEARDAARRPSAPRPAGDPDEGS